MIQLTRFLALFVFISASVFAADDSMQSIRGVTMGNLYQVTWHSKQLSDQQRLSLELQIEQRLLTLNQTMSAWRSDSLLSQFNNGPANAPLQINGDMATVLDEAFEIARLSNGALDITVGPLVKLWGFGPAHPRNTAPNASDIANTLQYVGLSHIRWQQGQLSKDHPNTEIDLSAIAKGYAVDVIAELVGQQIKHFWVDIGGEVVTRGVDINGQPWQVGIEQPSNDSRGTIANIQLSNMAVATSGDYRHYFDTGKQRYSHVIDPHSGQATRSNIISATVIAERCSRADGLATAMMVLGAEQALALAEQHQIPLMLIERQQQSTVVHHSTTFKAYLAHSAK